MRGKRGTRKQEGCEACKERWPLSCRSTPISWQPYSILSNVLDVDERGSPMRPRTRATPRLQLRTPTTTTMTMTTTKTERRGEECGGMREEQWEWRRMRGDDGVDMRCERLRLCGRASTDGGEDATYPPAILRTHITAHIHTCSSTKIR
jgi:hypothetical protein